MKRTTIFLLLRVAAYVLLLGLVLYGLYISPYNHHPHSAEDIRRWVMGFGDKARILYPQSVVEDCKKMARQVLEQYGG